MDVEVLASSLGRSIDDTILCIHMVLVQMTAHVSNRKFKYVKLVLCDNCNQTKLVGRELTVQKFGLS